ncbi:MAG: class I SAM-dependent methyltransferase [Syntrophomonadaceae bacterium]|nr:class I SAM-dependent methyltransferase [Syntrophomonadaceae bacterium]
MGNKAREFDRLVREVFAPIYPIIAAQVMEEVGFNEGLCLDIGTGSGYLGLNIAKISDFKVVAMDNNSDSIEVLKENISQWGLDSQVKSLLGDVHDIPLATNTVQLAVSRGSMFFWDEAIVAFNEIYRVLSPKGVGFIGGGFGNLETKAAVDQEMLKRNPKWLEKLNNRIGSKEPEKWRDIVSKTNIMNFNIIHNPVEMWIVFRK